MATKTHKVEMAGLVSFSPNGREIRTIGQWAQLAKNSSSLRNGQAAARNYAMQNGSSVIIWSDGHSSQYTFNRQTGAKTRIRYGKQAAAAAKNNSGLRGNYGSASRHGRNGW
jgi:hypothetical protein